MTPDRTPDGIPYGVDIAALLPAVMRHTLPDSPALAAMLEVMEGLLAPSAIALSEVHENFDPRRAPADWIPYLGSWLNIGLQLDQAGDGRLRELLAQSSELAHTRGTTAGLEKFLCIATGIQGVQVEQATDEAGRPLPFAIVVRLPASARTHKELVERLVALEKPAYVTHEVVC